MKYKIILLGSADNEVTYYIGTVNKTGTKAFNIIAEAYNKRAAALIVNALNKKDNLKRVN